MEMVKEASIAREQNEFRNQGIFKYSGRGRQATVKQRTIWI